MPVLSLVEDPRTTGSRRPAVKKSVGATEILLNDWALGRRGWQGSSVDQIQCTNCGASLPATGTYCLACDTPVEGANTGLSVSTSTVTKVGRPWVGVTVGIVVLAVIVGIVLGIRALIIHGQNSAAELAATTGVKYIVATERGQAGLCKPLSTTFVTGDPAQSLAACRALLGKNPSLKLNGLHTTAINRHGDGATVRLQGTINPGTGPHPFDQDVKLAKVQGTWKMDWDLQPIS
ncbi:MAG: hypothetical protein JWR52_1034 [Marmoricola sp.]|nr:hypothetical protein [Marmoricola sp.]